MSDDEGQPTVRVVYGDFGDPLCVLASQRLNALNSVGAGLEWRPVEQHPDAPVMGCQFSSQASKDLDSAMSAVVGRLLPGEVLRWNRPGFAVHTQAAVSAFAEADGAGVGDDVRRLLFSGYWVHRANIGDPEVMRRLIPGAILRGHSPSDPLRRFGYAVSPSRGPITTGAYERIRHWQNERAELGVRGDLVLVEDGRISIGLDVLDRLAGLMKDLNAPVHVNLPDPGRYPPQSMHPPLGWASQVGGTYRFSDMVSNARGR